MEPVQEAKIVWTALFEKATEVGEEYEIPPEAPLDESDVKYTD
jgi:hypothetical protein